MAVRIKRPLFRGKSTKRSGMNKTETEYAGQLRVRELAGEILWWRYESVKLRTTESFNGGLNATWYTADFVVMLPDGTLELHEVKGGFEHEKDILRLKATASIYPFSFVLARKLSRAKGGWKIERIQ